MNLPRNNYVEKPKGTDMSIHYEWDVVTFDEWDDIQGHHHSKKFPGLPPARDEGTRGKELVLVRDKWDDSDGDLTDRQHAYVENGILPEFFDYGAGAKVPKRFHLLLL